MQDRSASKSAGVARFFALALGFTWLLQLPALLAQRAVIPGPAERYVPLAALGGFGPLLAAVLAARAEGGREGVRALFRRLRIGPVAPGWFAAALFGFGAIHVAGMAVYALAGGEVDRWLYLPENGQQVAAMLMIPFIEETGWRGFALPRMIPRHGVLRASLLLGAAWAAWHAVMFALQGATPLTFVLMSLNVLLGSVVFGWLYQRTRGSLLVAVVAHAGVHLNNPTHALPARVAPFAVFTAAVAAAALAVAVLDRRAMAARTP